MGQDQRLHIVSLNGQTDLTGVSLPIYGPANTGIWSAGTSPDGDHLLYGDSLGLKYLDVHADKLTSITLAYKDATDDDGILLWSPAGDSVVVSSIDRGSAIVQLPSGVITEAPANNRNANGQRITATAYSWLDTTHLAVEDLAVDQPTPPTPSSFDTPQTIACLARLNIVNDHLQPIVTLRSPTMAGGFFSLTPDGTEALFSNADSQDLPFTPNVQRINLATGAATPLPHLESLLPALGGFSQLLWVPHTHLALAATGFAENGDVRYQLIDVDHDSATPVTLSGFPVAWSPGGQTLILATGDATSNANAYGFADVGIVDSGPYTLTAVTFDANWNIVQTVTLTNHAMQIPTLGFVRNP